jgi:ATP-dependent helicase/nuclease subunit A
MFGMMIAALRESGVPVAGADRLKPAENIAVQDMLALMRIMTLPEDDYELACVLKSPLVSRPLSEEELFGLCHAREGARLWTRLAASTEPAASICFSELSEWRRLALECRPYEFISRVLMRRKPDILARLGGEADDALQALSEQALAYEREHGASLSGFAEWFRSEKTEIRRDMDSGQGEVRLMTVHGAKGLEANIVMLPDAADFSERDRDRLLFVAGHGGAGDIPLWKLSGLMPSPSIDALKAELQAATQSEYTRLLYVAMTRARDELYICGAHEKDKARENSWYAMASAALSTDGFIRLADPAESAPVRRLGSDPEWMEKPDGPASRAETNKLPDCLGQALAAAAAAQPDLTPSRISNPGGGTFNAGAARAGRIYHRILELLPDKPAAERRGLVERKLAQAGLGGDYAGRLLAVLELPELEALFGEGSSGETGIGSRLADGRALYGVIDRLAVRDTDILLLDYKSDAHVPERTGPDHRHFRQMAGYCSGLQKMHPGKPIKAGILWLSKLRLDWLDPAEMAGAIAALEGQRELPKP